MMRILIVDDEPLARRRLVLLLAELGHEGPAVMTAEGVSEALECLEREPVDVVLLDIRMRDGTGFDLIRRLPPESAPAIVFVTAFDDFAVRAFEIAAADYLVKPVSAERLGLALDRAAQLVSSGTADSRRDALSRIAASEPSDRDRASAAGAPEREFWIRQAGGDFVRLEIAAIDYAVVEEDYVRIFAGDRSYLLRESIRGLRARLNPDEFVQVHRSAIVRISELAEITRSRMGRAEVLLRGGQRLPLGRVHGKAIQRLVR
jgi:two-component system LytT family response regulator